MSAHPRVELRHHVEVGVRRRLQQAHRRVAARPRLMRRTVGHDQANVRAGQLIRRIAARIDERPGTQPIGAVEVVGNERTGGGRHQGRRSAERRRRGGHSSGKGLRRREGIAPVGAIGGDPEAIGRRGGEVGEQRSMGRSIAAGGDAFRPGTVGGTIKDRAAGGERGRPADGGVVGAGRHLHIGDSQRRRTRRRVGGECAAERQCGQREQNDGGKAHTSLSRFDESGATAAASHMPEVRIVAQAPAPRD